MKSTTYFAVAYRYYQYNDGSANNGTFSAEQRCATAEEALSTAASINASAARRLASEERLRAESLARLGGKPFDAPEIEVGEDELETEKNLEYQLIPGGCGGYFISAEAQTVRVERMPLQGIVAEIKEEESA